MIKLNTEMIQMKPKFSFIYCLLKVVIPIECSFKLKVCKKLNLCTSKVLLYESMHAARICPCISPFVLDACAFRAMAR